MSRAGVAAFASPASALAALSLPVIAILPPLYAELGISLTAAGAIFGIARFFDVFTDPVFGLLAQVYQGGVIWGLLDPAGMLFRGVMLEWVLEEYLDQTRIPLTGKFNAGGLLGRSFSGQRPLVSVQPPYLFNERPQIIVW